MGVSHSKVWCCSRCLEAVQNGTEDGSNIQEQIKVIRSYKKTAYLHRLGNGVDNNIDCKFV